MTIENDLLAAVTPPAGDPLAELVGEGKKFKDAASLAAAKLESDRFIEQLKAENAAMRKDLDGKNGAGGDQTAATNALIERIEKAIAAKPANPDGSAGTLSRTEIEQLVKDGITTERSEASRRANYTKANAELLNHFKGDAATAQSHLKERVAALGLSGEALTEIASTNPKMFRELFVPNSRPQAGPATSLPAGRIPEMLDNSVERGRSHYAKLRKDMGAKFWDPAIQQQMFRDRKELGEKFNAI